MPETITFEGSSVYAVCPEEYDEMVAELERLRAAQPANHEPFAYGVEFDGLRGPERMVNMSENFLHNFIGKPFPLYRHPPAQPAVPDGWFIHAPDGKRVAISVTSMDKGYWESRGYTAQPFAMLAASQRKEGA